MQDNAVASCLKYLDFDLEIGPGQGREYPITVRCPAGEARETLRFPYDELALQSRLKDLQIALLRSGGPRRKMLSPEEQSVQDFGQGLFNALFCGEVRSRYDVSLREATRQGKGLRLKLRINAPELTVLPWEFLYDPRSGEYLCLSRNTPVIRYIELPQPIQPLMVTPPLRILGMVASPRDQDPLDVKREKERMEEALKGLQARGLVRLTWLEGQTWRDLQQAMRRGSWHVFHFIGHGRFDRQRDEGIIALSNEKGETYPLGATELARLLADHFSMRLVLLNACEGARGSERDIFSSTAAILVRRGIPAVLAMQFEITDQAAVEFARAFYEALADGLPVDAAIAEARKAVSLAVPCTLEWGIPVLYMRAPEGILFNLQEAKAPREEVPERIYEQDEKKPQPEEIKKRIQEEQRVKPDGGIQETQVPQEGKAFQPVKGEVSKGLKPYLEAPAAIQKERASISPHTVAHIRLLYCLQYPDLVRTVAFSPNGEILAVGTLDARIYLWRFENSLPFCILPGHNGGVESVAFSPDGRILASGSVDGTIRLWRIPEGWPLCTLTGHSSAVKSVALSPTGGILASGSSDSTVRLWRIQDRVLMRVLEGHKGAIRSVAFSPDGKVLASGSADKTVRLWQVANGQFLRRLEHKGEVESVAFSSDGAVLASGSSDGTIRIWSASDDTLLRELEGHNGAVLSVAFSPSHPTMLASGSSDRTVRLWQVTDQSVLRTLEGHMNWIGSVTFSPDGQILASGAYDRTVRLWGIALEGEEDDGTG
ncbi:MAG: CHAT domain-containing protein [Anaerolineae bacterium]|nr:CHAT domain-containing protein [Anaerolineae bacterium]